MRVARQSAASVQNRIMIMIQIITPIPREKRKTGIEKTE